MQRVKARKDAIVAASASNVEKWMRGLDNGVVYRGHARFVDKQSVKVNDAILTAEQICVDVGGRRRVPTMPGIDSVPYLTNVSMMDVDFVPEHLVVVGGSDVGLEFAQAFRRFGSRVSVVEMGPRLIGREDEDVSQAVKQFLEAEGLEVGLDAECASAERNGDRVTIGVDCKDGAPPAGIPGCC